jgi:hypothetical protein
MEARSPDIAPAVLVGSDPSWGGTLRRQAKDEASPVPTVCGPGAPECLDAFILGSREGRRLLFFPGPCGFPPHGAPGGGSRRTFPYWSRDNTTRVAPWNGVTR